MSNSIYASLTRQSGLLRELSTVANNIANASTTGYRQEGLVFAEYVSTLDGKAPSLSMATAEARMTSMVQGALTQTGAPLDLAIEGQGFFLIDTPAGQRLTRAGSFTPNEVGDLVTPDGHRLLDAGGAPVFVPADANAIAVSADGTLSADGQPLSQIGLYVPADPIDLKREDGVRFVVEGDLQPAETGRVLQGFLEGSNVDPIGQMARLIEVQRAYEMGQSFLKNEDERLRGAIQKMGRG